MKSNLQIILDSLNSGQPLEFDKDYDLVIQDDILYLNAKGTDILYQWDMSFNDFNKFCLKFTRDEIFLIGAQAALRNMKKEEAVKRNRRHENNL